MKVEEHQRKTIKRKKEDEKKTEEELLYKELEELEQKGARLQKQTPSKKQV